MVKYLFTLLIFTGSATHCSQNPNKSNGAYVTTTRGSNTKKAALITLDDKHVTMTRGSSTQKKHTNNLVVTHRTKSGETIMKPVSYNTPTISAQAERTTKPTSTTSSIDNTSTPRNDKHATITRDNSTPKKPNKLVTVKRSSSGEIIIRDVKHRTPSKTLTRSESTTTSSISKAEMTPAKMACYFVSRLNDGNYASVERILPELKHYGPVVLLKTMIDFPDQAESIMEFYTLPQNINPENFLATFEYLKNKDYQFPCIQ